MRWKKRKNRCGTVFNWCPTEWLCGIHLYECVSLCVWSLWISYAFQHNTQQTLRAYSIATWFDKTFTYINNVEGNTSSILILLFVTHYLSYIYFTSVVCVCVCMCWVCFRPVSKWVSGINELQVHKYMCCHTNFISFWINICCELEIDFSSFYLFIAFMSEMCTPCCRCICNCRFFSAHLCTPLNSN